MKYWFGMPTAGQGSAAQIVVERAMSNGAGAPFRAAGTDAPAAKLQ